MKHIYYTIALLLTSLLVISCQQDDELSEAGYLRLEVGTNAYVKPSTRISEDYNPKQIAVQIVDATGSVVKSTDDWETLKGKQIRLTPGVYTVKASSNGFDGNESGFDIPYYTGSQEVTIEKGKEATASITCTLANVKVTVNYDQTFKDAFTAAVTTVTSGIENIASLQYEMGKELKPGYFPVGKLEATISVTNKANQLHQATYSIQHADGSAIAARDHFILNFKVAESGGVGGDGEPGVDVTVDGSEVIYTFTFNVATEATTQFEVQEISAWSNFAYLVGNITAQDQELDASLMKFEYKEKSATEWNALTATVTSDNSTEYTAKLTGLTPNTIYEYRMAYRNGSDEFVSEAVSFTTEAATTLYNGGFEDWYGVYHAADLGSGQLAAATTQYPILETDYNAGYRFWDTSNPGTTTGAGSIVGANPTQKSTNKKSGTYSAELKSDYQTIKFAAASLYAGEFGELVGTDGAKINFGRPFISRPTQMTGYYKYSTSTINYRQNEKVTESNLDLWSAYIVLVNGSLIAGNTENAYTLNNTDMSGTSKDFNALLNDANDSWVVAYGALDDSKCVPASEWTEFTVDLTYKNLTAKPTHIIIVFSSSKYGDYFTGSTSSLLYLDDIELVYGDEPKVVE
ncbi:MAG: DUF4493 domain-containing protein [Bacteroides sp.]|nr:DUF4493 domain-containing protein [Bacteroides sp.]